VKASQKDYSGAFASLKEAGKYAKTDEEKVFFHVGRIRVYSMGMALADKDWINEAKDDFDDAVKINPKSSAAYYFMGMVYKAGLDFNQAGQMFRRVLDLAGEYVKEADAGWNFTQKVQRAMPGTVTGRIIAVVERITRADAAALFMEEMKIDVLYQKRTPKTFDTAFKDPEKAKAAAAKHPATASDIADHPLKADIEAILKIGVRGLENYPDGSFHPNDLVDRAAYAMMLEDILIRVTGDNALATKFIGSASPFPDLRSDLPYFNAVMVVTSRGIMEAKDFATGEFAPLSPVSGVDALLIIRKIKEELKFF
jgi:tetratricopeptide (TPR) repeat protein